MNSTMYSIFDKFNACNNRTKDIKFMVGTSSNYSSGLVAFTCFEIIGIYIAISYCFLSRIGRI